jgi:hypothetical protein
MQNRPTNASYLRARGRCGLCDRRSPGYDLGDGRRRWRALDLGTTKVFLEANAPCGCRKLVRIADLGLCPSDAHGVRDHRSCAIHPNHPVADALATSHDRGGWSQASNWLGGPPPSRSARSSGLPGERGRAASRWIRSGRAKHLLSMPRRVSGTHRGRRAASPPIRSGRAKHLLSTPGRVFGTHRPSTSYYSEPYSTPNSPTSVPLTSQPKIRRHLPRNERRMTRCRTARARRGAVTTTECTPEWIDVYLSEFS